jgi:hypothetical protein
MYSEQEVKQYMENGIKSEQEEPPEDEMIDIANEFVDVLRRSTGKSLDDITNDLPDFVKFVFSFSEQALLAGGVNVRDDERAEEDARSAFGDIDEVEDAVFNNLPNKIDRIEVEDSLHPVSISFDWDFTEHTVTGGPGDWEVVY